MPYRIRVQEELVEPVARRRQPREVSRVSTARN
jgi:hypothetical protein